MEHRKKKSLKGKNINFSNKATKAKGGGRPRCPTCRKPLPIFGSNPQIGYKQYYCSECSIVIDV